MATDRRSVGFGGVVFNLLFTLPLTVQLHKWQSTKQSNYILVYIRISKHQLISIMNMCVFVEHLPKIIKI